MESRTVSTSAVLFTRAPMVMRPGSTLSGPVPWKVASTFPFGSRS